MRAKSFEGMACSIAVVLDAVGDRWAMLILRDLVLGLRRYDDLRRSTGISNATLADRLKQLEQNGLIERRLYQSGPDRHEYLPSAKGRDIALVLQALAQVGDQWGLGHAAAPPLQFMNAKTGQRVRLGLVEEGTGAPVRRQDLRVEPGPGADDLMRWRLSPKAESR